MRLSFNIHYHTSPELQVYLSGSTPELGSWNPRQAVRMHFQGNGHWQVWLELQANTERIDYKYLLIHENGQIVWEWGINHCLDLRTHPQHLIFLADQWQNPSAAEKVFYTSSFMNVLMKPGENAAEQKPADAGRIFRFRISVPRISENYKVCILGNQPVLGNWNRQQPFVLDCNGEFPIWSGETDASKLRFPIIYKYGIWSINEQRLVTMEEGFDREIGDFPNFDSDFVFQKTDSNFMYPLGNWKAAGVAVPVFSLRGQNSFGVGDFGDLISFIDWAKSVGMRMVQLLPVNETVASHNWLDSYPYKSISVMALHPIYLNIEKMGKLNDPAKVDEFDQLREKLNAEMHVDYPEVHRIKSRFYKLLYDQDGEKTLNSNSFKQFFKANKDWLIPYAAFVFLRDRYKTADFRNWDGYRYYDKYKIEELTAAGSDCRDDVLVHYFIQFHLDKQLKEASAYARANGLILKGDIPIGISPNSVEAWTEPHLFNLEAQAGAPPDEFAVKGQNWGFPTYNWTEMARDNYSWWIKRMQKMADYFDSYRIDHILGFFRIWEVPGDAVEALLGHFNPAMPLSAEEIEQYGLRFDYERFTQPYIRKHLLIGLFGDETEQVTADFLDDLGGQKYRLKEEFDSQRKINSYFLDGIEEEELPDNDRKIRDGLFELAANVVFVSTGYNQWHPRISMQKTSSFQELDYWTQTRLTDLYNDFFFHRHEEFWYAKGMEKLPTIVSVGNMMVCGEDLGMIPATVPKAMAELNILSLEIQRMPKNPKKTFAHPADAPYLSVCTTSTHDMPTIRGWWEEDPEKSQLFYNQELGNWGAAPFFAEPDLCRQIIVQHLYSPAMWTTFPIQDLLAMDGELRWEATHEEQINLPANVRHKWRYRMKQSLDELKNATQFNELLRTLLKESGRSSDY